MIFIHRLLRVISSYWIYIKPVKYSYFLMIILYIIGMILMGVVMPLYYGKVVEAVSIADKHYAWQSLYILAALFLGGYVCDRIGDYLNIDMSIKSEKSLQADTYKRLMKQSLGFFNDRFTGSLIAQQQRYSKGLDDVMIELLVGNLTRTLTEMIGIMVVFYFISPILMILSLLWVVLFNALGVYIAFIRLPYDTAYNTSLSTLTGYLSDAITNIMAVKSYCHDDRETSRYDIQNEDTYKKSFIAGWV